MPDYLRPAITRELVPVLKQAGFTRSKPAHFLRADGDILHSIALIRSRYGGDNLMLAYRIGLLCDPLLDIDNQPAGLGDIIQNRGWYAATEKDTQQSLATIRDDCIAHILPWLAAHNSIPAYLAAQPDPKQRSNADDLAYSIARLCDGEDPAIIRRDCAHLADPTHYWEITTHETVLMQHALALVAVIDAGGWQPLLARWATENRRHYRL